MNVPLIPATVPAINEAQAEQATTATPADDVTVVTVITSARPATAGKQYRLNATRDGLDKQAPGPLLQGTAESVEIVGVGGMAKMLRTETEKPDAILLAGCWRGDDDGTPFQVVTEKTLSDKTGHAIHSAELAGLHSLPDGLFAARLKRGIVDARVLTFDRDHAPGEIREMAELDMQACLEKWDAIFPGLSKAPRVQIRSASARVRHRDEPEKGATRAYVFLKAVANLDVLREHAKVAMVLNRLSFPSPRFNSRTGEEIGRVHRGVFDLAVFNTGRLDYIAKPTLDQAAIDAGYVIDPANVEIVNPEGDLLDVSGIAKPSDEDLAQHYAITGERLHYTSEGTSLAVRSTGLLTLATEIESEGTVRTFGQWLAKMTEAVAAALTETAAEAAKKLRCEAPFRDSKSEAAFIRWTGPEAGYVHDIGCTTTYLLDASSLHHERCRALRFAFERIFGAAPEDTERRWEAEAVASRERMARHWDVTPLRTHAVKVVKGDDLGDVDRAMAVLKGVRPRLFWRGRLVTAADVPMKFMQADGSTIERKVRGVQTVSAVALAPLLSGAADFYTERRATAKELAEAAAAALAQATTDNAPAPAAEVATLPADANRPAMVKASIYVPPRICKAILEDRRLADHVPLLTGLSSLPIMNVMTGDIDTVRGYDPVSGFWIDGDSAITVPERPGRDDAVRALAVLRELEAGFPFATDVDRDTFIAGLMGAFVRAGLPTLPGVFVTAPVSGTGKSHVTKTIGAASLGVIPAAMSWPNSKEEMDKHLDGLALAGVSTILLDNVNHRTFKSEMLEKFITEPTLEVRELGGSKVFNVNTPGTLALINGNDSEPHADMAQRLLQCRLDAAMENPRERVFDGDPLAAVIAQRARYASAAMTMARAYIHAGAPDAVGYASFEVWSRVVRSALLWAGGCDVLEGVREGVANDPQAEKRRRLLAFVRDVVFPMLPTDARSDWRFKAAHVDAAMSSAGADGAVLAVALGLDMHGGEQRAERLGLQLKAWSGMVATMDDGQRVRVVKAPRRSDGMWWRLQVLT